MKSYRIGKTLKIRWGILTGGKSEPLSGRDLRLEIATGSRFRRDVSFEADGSVAEFVFQGSEQRYVGAYTVTMWENRGKENQTVVDRCDAFCLVACSCEESAESADEPNLDVETLELGSSNLETGVPGKSAYELFKEHNPDSELTEEQYAEAPVQAAEAALAMVEQLEKTDAAVKQAEQLRKQAEQGREASERVRTTAEQARVTAEQQRALAEQTRVTNESARQTAEAGRRTAEAKREQNTSEAIRNSEDAARKAEDEAARVRTLADNPPKIVEVEGVQYWAFYNEETKQYVTSEYPARGEKGDPGDPGSGSDVNVVQGTGQSTTDVMSQKAVTDALDKKVDAEQGKGLSANDYTNEEKEKVAAAVLVTTQTLAEEQQTQARNNIGAASASVIGDLSAILDEINGVEI